MPELFLEIGTEEIPAGFARQALADLARLLAEELDRLRLAHGPVRTLGTPRRLAAVAENVAERQEDRIQEIQGPPVRVARDASGKLTKAGEAFERKVADLAASVDAVIVEVDTPKGQYLLARVPEKGRPAREILPDAIARVLETLPFQKSMRWGRVRERFVRPILWIVALYDGEVIPFTFAGVQSGRASRGHRFLAPEPFEVLSFEHYLAHCEKVEVIPDPAARRAEIERELLRAGPPDSRVISSEDLLDEVTFLVEKPFVIPVSFPREYLEIPDRLLLAVLEKQLRCFAYGDAEGRLLPLFAFVAGTRPRDPEVVARGALKVARARFDDALFYLREDRKKRLSERAEALRGVVFLRGLGTLHDKVGRVEALAVDLAGVLAPERVEKAREAARLCKADLVTGVVKEFPELQGTIGREYARREGIDPEVAEAIFEHYRPRGAGDGPPEGDLGAILAIADKLDSLAGCFRIGQEPTGTADPLALRRQALGIVATVLARGYHLSLSRWLSRALAAYDGVVEEPPEPALRRLLAFFEGRLRALWGAEHPADAVDAVLAAGFDDLLDARARLVALVEFERRPDFKPVATTFKRVSKILKDAPDGPVDPARFEENEERALHAAVREVGERVRALTQGHDFAGALAALAALGGPVDTFFAKVFVMHEDPMIRNNRFALLGEVARLSRDLLDFGRLQAD
jgi:glycyl-tRNA synthetase beta chain